MSCNTICLKYTYSKYSFYVITVLWNLVNGWFNHWGLLQEICLRKWCLDNLHIFFLNHYSYLGYKTIGSEDKLENIDMGSLIPHG